MHLKRICNFTNMGKSHENYPLLHCWSYEHGEWRNNQKIVWKPHITHPYWHQYSIQKDKNKFTHINIFRVIYNDTFNSSTDIFEYNFKTICLPLRFIHKLISFKWIWNVDCLFNCCVISDSFLFDFLDVDTLSKYILLLEIKCTRMSRRYYKM